MAITVILRDVETLARKIPHPSYTWLGKVPATPHGFGSKSDAVFEARDSSFAIIRSDQPGILLPVGSNPIVTIRLKNTPN
jgi:hypothetical protein